MPVKTIPPRDVPAFGPDGKPIEIIDVRTPIEYREVHIRGAKLIPLDELDPRQIRSNATGAPLYLVCKSGGRAAKACEKFAAAGFDNLFSIEGGTTAWEAAGLPVVHSQSCISLERQVRIAAGTLVLIGIALGALVHPAFYALAALVGAGLVFAGVTDFCGMAMLLAKMPWNKRQKGCGAECHSTSSSSAASPAE